SLTDAEKAFIFEASEPLFGLRVLNTIEKELSSELAALLDERANARANKNFTLSDEIRDQLLAAGIEVRDSSEGQKWKWIKI
ncbi:MAG: hypothetical protein RL733_630, partial [Actinomycetota bacterium]